MLSVPSDVRDDNDKALVSGAGAGAACTCSNVVVGFGGTKLPFYPYCSTVQ